MKTGVVSIVIPCYNIEKYIFRMLESILKQTYKQIELILVNDGSTDQTGEVILSYYDRLRKNCESVIYKTQENKGAAAAINLGLKYVSGEYFIWADGDDFFEDNSIEERVKFLKKYQQYDVVGCDGWVVGEDVNTKIRQIKRADKGELSVENVIRGKSFPIAGYFMVRTEKFLLSINNRTIIESREGQNYQILIPISYYCRCGYIEKDIYNIVYRHDSHSRIRKKHAAKIERMKQIEQLLKDIIKSMNIKEEAYYINLVTRKYKKLYKKMSG